MFIMHALISIQTMFGQLFEYESIFILSKNNSFVMGIDQAKMTRVQDSEVGVHCNWSSCKTS